MSNMGIRGSAPPVLTRSSTAPMRARPVTPSSAPTPTSSVSRSPSRGQLQTTNLNQLTSQETLQTIHSTIESTPVETMKKNAGQCLKVLGEHPLTQGLSKGHDLSEKLGEFETTKQLGEVMDSLTEKFEMGETTIPTAEAKIFEKLTGVSTDHMSSLKEVLSTGQQVMQVAKTAQCLNEAYQSYGTPEFSGKVENLAKVGYMSLGGESTVELTSKVSDFCQKCDLDSGKEMMSALAKFSTDDSFIASTERGMLSMLTGAPSIVGKSVPFLSYGSAVLDTGIAAKTGYDWWQGKTSGTELCKSTITALGSASGATVAPVVGPLAATAINYGIDGVSSGYTAISNWWNS